MDAARFTANLIYAARLMNAAGRPWSDPDVFELVRLAVYHAMPSKRRAK